MSENSIRFLSVRTKAPAYKQYSLLCWHSCIVIGWNSSQLNVRVPSSYTHMTHIRPSTPSWEEYHCLSSGCHVPNYVWWSCICFGDLFGFYSMLTILFRIAPTASTSTEWLANFVLSLFKCVVQNANKITLDTLHALENRPKINCANNILGPRVQMCLSLFYR